MFKSIACAVALAGAALTAIAAPAEAGLIGKTFTVGYYYPDGTTPYGAASGPITFTAGSGVDAVITVENILAIDVDLSDDGLSVLFDKLDTYTGKWNAASFSGLVITLQDSGAIGFSGIEVTPTTAMPGFDTARASITPTQITLNWQGLAYDEGTAVNAVLTPVPAAALLLGPALLGLGAAARRRA